MPIVDMPVEELYAYKGKNPCPADLDAFWDRSVSEMEALGTSFTLEEASFQTPQVGCYHLYFTGINGARIHAKFLRPRHISAPMPALLVFHGYPGKSPDYAQLLAHVQAGFIVAAMDCRGQAGLSEDVGGVKGNTQCGQIIRGLEERRPEKLLYRDIFLDTAQLARILMAMPEVDETRVGAMGGSQGGGLTLACAALTPGLNRIAPTFPFLCDYRRVWDMDLDVDAYAELRSYFRSFDPRHEREEEIFTLLGYIDNQHLAHRIRAEVMMFTGLIDTICPPSTQFAAYNKILSPKRVVFYPDFGHEYLPEADDLGLTFLMGMQSR